MILQRTDIIVSENNTANHRSESIFLRRVQKTYNTTSAMKLLSTISSENKYEKNDSIEMISNDSFFYSIGPVLMVAQCFGLMPVEGITGSNIDSVKFQWRSFRVIVTSLNICAGIVFLITNLLDNIKEGISAKNIVGVIFFLTCLSALFFFLILAQKWSEIIKTWYNHEKVFLCKPYIITGWRLSTKIRCTSAIILGLAAVEHLMFLASSIYSLYKKVIACDIEVKNWWDFFFINQFGNILKYLPYHFLESFFLEYFNIALTFGWNYMDLFIMVISIGISSRFDQLNRRLSQMDEQILPEKIWSQLRLDFVSLCELVEYIDKNLAAIILLSCANNLYFICFQLLNIFNKLPYTINKIYFWYSLLYLIGRASIVYLCAASIHDSSKKPLPTLRSIPSNGWCNELERFTEQVRSELIALSGNNFFFMTRKLLFGMAGTIVTYELVLLQFDQGSKAKSNSTSICD